MPMDNINNPILRNNSEVAFQLFNINHFGTLTVSNMGSENINTQSILTDIHEDNENSFDGLNINFHPLVPINTNENVLSAQMVGPLMVSTSTNENVLPEQRFESANSKKLNDQMGMDKNMFSWHNQNMAKTQFEPITIQNTIPEEQLTIDISSDSEETHSWRPNLTNSLSSDFFLTQPMTSNEKVAEFDSDNPIEQNKTAPLQFLWDSNMERDVVISDVQQLEEPFPEALSPLQINVQKHLQLQKAQINTIKYEVINAKRKAHELKDKVEKLTYEWKEKLLLKNSPDMQKLRDEHAQLRIECQCLCMEVDYYVKGQAPLGEVDETFYRGHENHSLKNDPPKGETIALASNESCASEQQEEMNRWDCPKCTFANHSAINSCEMCQTPRFRKQSLPFLASSNDSCYCHPKEHACS